MMNWLNKISRKLEKAPCIPWRLRHHGGPLNTIIYRPLRQYKMYKMLSGLKGEDDITVIYPIKNRIDYKVWHSFASIRSQCYPQHLVHILVVDYGSDDQQLSELRNYCQRFDAKILETKLSKHWSKSHCLNIGIKRATSKFILSIDSDIILAPNYVESLVNMLKRQPLSVVFSQCRDLPPSCENELMALFEVKKQAKADYFYQFSSSRSIGNCNPGINATYTSLYHLIRGYDELFQSWGWEDNDLKDRFECLGLESRSIAAQSYYLHQWHPKYDGWHSRHDGTRVDNNLQQQFEDNWEHFKNNRDIVKNSENWGEFTNSWLP